MSRASVKTSIKTVLQTVGAIKTVYTSLPRQQPGTSFPSVVIMLEKTHEKVATMGNPSKRHITFTVTLYIQSIDADPDEIASQTRFDDLLDAIDTALRANKSLSGTVLASASIYIDTDVLEPQLSGQGLAIILRATKTFDVLVEIIG